VSETQNRKKKNRRAPKSKNETKKETGDRSETKKKHRQNKKNKKMKLKKLSVIRYIILKIKIKFIFSLNPFFISKYPVPFGTAGLLMRAAHVKVRNQLK
jgi:hypothetical protein